MRLLILTYHYFHRQKPYGIKPEDSGYSVGFDQLAEHCREIQTWPGSKIEPACLKDKSIWTDPKKGLLITIDDGHKSTYRAAEMLLEHRIRPLLFVIPERIGQEHYLTWEELRQLADDGCCIQSHSMSHTGLTHLSPGDLEYELNESRKIIEDNLGHHVYMLAAPMGKIDQRVADKAMTYGYKIIMTSFTGINSNAGDCLFMRRFQVKANNLQLRLEKYFSKYSSRRIEGAIKNMVKKIKGTILY